MVDQVCKRCGSDTSTDLKNLSNYCSHCGWQWFRLKSESIRERNSKMFEGKSIISWRGKTFRKKKRSK